MNLLPRWMRAGAQHQAPEHEPDPGDMGTAFGLDASLAAQGEGLAPSAPCAEDERRWQQRLDRRPVR